MMCCHMFIEVLVPEGHLLTTLDFREARGSADDLYLDKLLCDPQGQYDPVKHAYSFGEECANPITAVLFWRRCSCVVLGPFNLLLILVFCPGTDTPKACRLGSFRFSLDLVRFVCPRTTA